MEEYVRKYDDYDNKIKLYNLLVEQILKYESIIWQIPTALVVGNFLAIEKFITNPFPLLALAIFNYGLIFVFHRMVKSQRRIIEATIKAENKLREVYSDYLPTFKSHRLPAPFLFIGILSLLEIILIVYIIILFAK